MALETHPAASDLWLPLPEDGAAWEPHTIHTHYFGFSIPEAEIGAFLYVRYQPAFPLCQGGVCLFRGRGNVQVTDMDFVDYEMTMPWPAIDGHSITTANGLRIELLEPGRVARISYTSNDGRTSLDVTQTAVTPLFARGHVMPGEDERQDASMAPGGSEQFMHVTGELVLRGERFAVDCHAPRDRSWRQVRVERQGAVPVPPVGWSPMWFGDDLVLSQVSFEAPDTDPAWAGIYQVPPDRPTHHFAWIVVDGEARDVRSVRRDVLERDPFTYMALRQELELVDETGAAHRFSGEALATATLPAWPNVSFHDSVFRWQDERGRTTHASYQEIWFDDFQRAMRDRFLAVEGAA
ncbi:tyrosine protein kinase [Conexibacter sp. SYSU D00693]|uniref:tyrosine protein kinase n=1 Tax=Conexibacter sp. SYSU D00693 TaxID=2812560 RepID=UPI00196A2A9C|nr:tyrosine protein kinase [Conexibacter sp. SYSU D00693]